MKFTIIREVLLKPLQKIHYQISGRFKFPILGNVLLEVNDNILSLTSTDLEIEIIAKIIIIKEKQNGSVTVSIRKLYNICRGLPENSEIKINIIGQRLSLQSQESHFFLSTLPAIDFPSLPTWKSNIQIELPQKNFKKLIEATYFSMANQDVRYYLNGMLFETEGYELRTVTTNGHRLALCSIKINQNLAIHSVIVPRKSVLEFIRLLSNSNILLKLEIGTHNIRIYIDNFIFTSKLIDGDFANYKNVLPKNPDKILTAYCKKLHEVFSRAAILSNEQFNSVNLYIDNNKLKITTNNNEYDEFEEIVDIEYNHIKININLNVNYILDVLNALKCEKIVLLLNNSNSSILIKDINNHDTLYVIMPIYL